MLTLLLDKRKCTPYPSTSLTVPVNVVSSRKSIVSCLPTRALTRQPSPLRALIRSLVVSKAIISGDWLKPTKYTLKLPTSRKLNVTRSEIVIARALGLDKFLKSVKN